MANKSGTYIYAGERMGGDKLHHYLVEEDGEESIYFVDRKREHFIGERVDITFKEDGRFTRNSGGESINDDERIKKWRIETSAAREEKKQHDAKERMRKHRDKLNDMTVAEIAEYCKNNYARKREVFQYLQERILW